MESIMKNLILAAIAALSLGIGTAYAAPAQQQQNNSWHPGSHSYPSFNVGGDGAAG
jgi:hypothetical protein